jgi:hypothetical protein
VRISVAGFPNWQGHVVHPEGLGIQEEPRWGMGILMRDNVQAGRAILFAIEIYGGPPTAPQVTEA